PIADSGPWTSNLKSLLIGVSRDHFGRHTAGASGMAARAVELCGTVPGRSRFAAVRCRAGCAPFSQADRKRLHRGPRHRAAKLSAVAAAANQYVVLANRCGALGAWAFACAGL